MFPYLIPVSLKRETYSIKITNVYHVNEECFSYICEDKNLLLHKECNKNPDLFFVNKPGFFHLPNFFISRGISPKSEIFFY